MTPLPLTVGKAGFELSQLIRNGKVAIYRQHRPGSDSVHDTYEVILPQVRNTNHKGDSVDPYEAFPSKESWGKKGWTFTTFDEAFNKLLQLIGRASCAGTASPKIASVGRTDPTYRTLRRSRVKAITKRSGRGVSEGRQRRGKIDYLRGCRVVRGIPLNTSQARLRTFRVSKKTSKSCSKLWGTWPKPS